MKNLNDVWNDLVRNKDGSICTTDNSMFMIMNGYKIERTDDGIVTIYDTRNRSDFYAEIGVREEFIFIRNGFKKGGHILSIDYLQSKLDESNELVRYFLSNDKEPQLIKAKEQRKDIIKRLKNHYNKLK